MSHPLQMSLSLSGWSIEPELLEDIRIELLHSEMSGDEMRVKLSFKAGREVSIAGDLKEGQGVLVYDALQQGIGSHS
jgi:hypothetical protein